MSSDYGYTSPGRVNLGRNGEAGVDVYLTHYAIWKDAYHLNQLGDATGDNVSDAADYRVWRDQ